MFSIAASVYLPTMMSSRSVACGLMRVQMSIVKRVLLLLKMEAKEDMRAANITASIRPRNPAQVCGRKEGVWKKRGRLEEGLGWDTGKKRSNFSSFLKVVIVHVSLPFGMIDTTSLG